MIRLDDVCIDQDEVLITLIQLKFNTKKNLDMATYHKGSNRRNSIGNKSENISRYQIISGKNLCGVSVHNIIL